MVLLSTSSFAQLNHFIIKGSVKNFEKPSFNLLVTGFFSDREYSVSVDNKGNFSQYFQTDGIQDIYLYLNDDSDALVLFAVPDDTITINWDEKNFKSTINVTSSDGNRAQELNLMLDLYKYNNEAFKLMNKQLQEEGTTDFIKNRLINDSFNGGLRLVESYPPSENLQKIAYDIYYKYANHMRANKLIQGFNLSVSKDFKSNKFNVNWLNYKYQSEGAFYVSYTYRNFIFNLIRFSSPFKSVPYLTGDPDYVNINPVKSDYNLGQSFINRRIIKDWYLAKVVMSGFDNYRFEDAKQMYDQFLAECTTASYLDTLKVFYDKIKKLAPGQPAPTFTLKDINGKRVSLSDFKGKMVYLNFWGVYCGASEIDITIYGPKVHEKYKNKDIIFINICIDERGEQWKKIVKEWKMEGVNLVLENGIKDPVCQDYNIKEAPNYVLIDKNGIIINNNAPRLMEMLHDLTSLPKSLER